MPSFYLSSGRRHTAMPRRTEFAHQSVTPDISSPFLPPRRTRSMTAVSHYSKSPAPSLVNPSTAITIPRRAHPLFQVRLHRALEGRTRPISRSLPLRARSPTTHPLRDLRRAQQGQNRRQEGTFGYRHLGQGDHLRGCRGGRQVLCGRHCR